MAAVESTDCSCKNPSSVLSTRMVAHNCMTPVPGDLMTSLVLHMHCMQLMNTQSLIHKVKINTSFCKNRRKQERRGSISWNMTESVYLPKAEPVSLGTLDTSTGAWLLFCRGECIWSTLNRTTVCLKDHYSFWDRAGTQRVGGIPDAEQHGENPIGKGLKVVSGIDLGSLVSES